MDRDIYIYNIYIYNIYSLKVACPSKLFFFASPKQPRIWSFRKEKLLVTGWTFKSSPSLKKAVAHLRPTKKCVQPSQDASARCFSTQALMRFERIFWARSTSLV